ncbi:HMG box protein [Seiridium cupressi]
MAHQTPEAFADLHDLEKLAEYNAQEIHPPYGAQHYGSQVPYSNYPDPAQIVGRTQPYFLSTASASIDHVYPVDMEWEATGFSHGLSMTEFKYRMTNYGRQNNVYASTPDTRASSPNTSVSTRMTRSGRPIGSSPLGPQPAGVKKSSTSKPKQKPKKKKKKRRRKNGEGDDIDDDEPPLVLEPLTVLLAHMDPKKDADINEFVNRPAEVRLKEAQMDKKGKIKRPMNAFMLYRKGWQNRIKETYANENNQIVSKVAGDGWHIEPDEVRNQYGAWAGIERDNHMQTFPSYKFQPEKNKKRAKPIEFSDAEDTDLGDDWSRVGSAGNRGYVANDDPDDEYRPPGRVSASRVYGYQHPVPPSRAVSHSPYEQSPYQHHSPPPPPVHNMSHYQYSNPHQSMPNPYPSGGSGHYHTQRVDMQHHQIPQPHASYTIPPQPYQTENVYYYRTQTPYQMSHSPQEQRDPYTTPESHYYDYVPQAQHQQPPPPPPVMSRSQHATPAPGYYQSVYAAPFEDPVHYAPPPPQATPNNDGADNFAAAMGEMGDYGDQFQLAAGDDPAYELNFPLGDGTDDILDPQLLDQSGWTAEALPLNALERPDHYLDLEKSAAVPAPEPEPEPTPTSTSSTSATAPMPSYVLDPIFDFEPEPEPRPKPGAEPGAEPEAIPTPATSTKSTVPEAIPTPTSAISTKPALATISPTASVHTPEHEPTSLTPTPVSATSTKSTIPPIVATSDSDFRLELEPQPPSAQSAVFLRLGLRKILMHNKGYGKVRDMASGVGLDIPMMFTGGVQASG